MKVRRRIAGVLLAIAAVAGALGLLVGGLDQRERDRYAIRERVRDIERKIRAHDGTVWLLVEGGFPPGEEHPAVEPAHDRLRDDLDRLAHLGGPRLVVQRVDVDADTAWADYLVEGTAFRTDEPPAPVAGRFTFRRTRDRWVLSGNRFAEGLPKDSDASPSPSSRRARHVHRPRGETLATRLLATALLAAFAAVALLAQPWVAQTLRRKRPARGDSRGDRTP